MLRSSGFGGGKAGSSSGVFFLLPSLTLSDGKGNPPLSSFRRSARCDDEGPDGASAPSKRSYLHVPTDRPFFFIRWKSVKKTLHDRFNPTPPWLGAKSAR